MGKLFLYLVFALAIGGAWWMYSGQIEKVEALDAEIKELTDAGTREADEKLPAIKTKRYEAQGVQTFNGILLAFLSAGAVGILFVFQVLPAIAHKFTHAIYDSGEMVESDPMHDARSLFAQGDYEGAIESFREVAAADPSNRFPWVEIAKIQRDNLKDSEAAVETIRTALEGHEWEVDDAAFFMFRLAEIYNEDFENPEASVEILQQVCELFPETRHSANARHKLNEFGIS
jgi:tetratricopeptide (TPR) repeat protein